MPYATRPADGAAVVHRTRALVGDTLAATAPIGAAAAAPPPSERRASVVTAARRTPPRKAGLRPRRRAQPRTAGYCLAWTIWREGAAFLAFASGRAFTATD